MLYASPLANKPEAKVGPGLRQIFMATLADIDDDLLKAAAAQHIATSKWFPAVADLRETAASLIQRADGAPDSYTAWQQVKRHMRGGPQPHPLARRAIDALGGLREFGLSDVSDEPAWRARFIAAYEQYQRRQLEDAMTLPIVTDYIQKRRELNGQSMAGMIAALTGKMTGQEEV